MPQFQAFNTILEILYSVGKVARLWALCSIPSRERSFHFSKVSRPTLRPYPASYPPDIRGYPLGQGMGWSED
jgi:hypothetical protein